MIAMVTEPNRCCFLSLQLNGLLPPTVFIRVISSLLSHGLALIRRKALDLLNNRLPQTTYNSQEVRCQRHERLSMEYLLVCFYVFLDAALDHSISPF